MVERLHMEVLLAHVGVRLLQVQPCFEQLGGVAWLLSEASGSMTIATGDVPHRCRLQTCPLPPLLHNPARRHNVAAWLRLAAAKAKTIPKQRLLQQGKLSSIPRIPGR
jgi:hypothetical protein